MSITRKIEYKVDEASYLLDLPSRSVIALCDAGVIQCVRCVANGHKKQRKRRYISHDEIVRFNISRRPDSRSDLAARLVDPDGPEQLLLPIPAGDDGDPAVKLTGDEWRAFHGAANVIAMSRGVVVGRSVLANALDKMGIGGDVVIRAGLKVLCEQGILT